MSAIYEMIGRLVVTLVWRTYGRQIQTAAIVGAGAAALAAVAYVATRENGDQD
jgi:uncharacterized membrane protein YebE (DUF533 family)